MQDICLDRYGKITSYKSKHKKGNYIAAIPFVTQSYESSNFLSGELIAWKTLSFSKLFDF